MNFRYEKLRRVYNRVSKSDIKFLKFSFSFFSLSLSLLSLTPLFSIYFLSLIRSPIGLLLVTHHASDLSSTFSNRPSFCGSPETKSFVVDHLALLRDSRDLLVRIIGPPLLKPNQACFDAMEHLWTRTTVDLAEGDKTQLAKTPTRCDLLLAPPSRHGQVVACLNHYL